jgi:inner membrane transporter RhtA
MVCASDYEFNFLLSIERIPIGLAVTEFIGPLLVAVLAQNVLDYLWVLLAAAGCFLIAPWTNNGINVLGVLFAFIGRSLWAFILFGRKVSK